MQRWSLGLVMALVACPRPEPEPPEDTADTPTEQVDTAPETGEDLWETGPDTDTDGDSDSFAVPDGSGAFPEPPDTADCPFGEILDCDGICYPESYIGDGTCDDGSDFHSNFDCVQFLYDDGDCTDDTDTGIILGGCAWEMVTTTRGDAQEMGWEIRTASGQLVYKVDAGTYATDNRVYRASVTLSDGDYVVVMTDRRGNGWPTGAGYVLHAEHDPTLVLSASTLSSGARREEPFTADCTNHPAAPVCGDVRVEIATEDFGGEISWDIVDSSNTVRASGGNYLSHMTYTDRISLGEGNFHMRLYDMFGDGWFNGRYTITDRVSERTIARGTLDWGDYAAHPFPIACSPGFEPMTDDTNPPFTPATVEITCDPAALVIHTGDNGHEVGWSLRNAGGVVLEERAPGAYASNTTYYVEVPVRTDDYTVEMVDAGGDGWQGGRLELLDLGTAAVLAETTMPSGASQTWALSPECSGAVVPVDTDPPTTDPPAVCAPHAAPDCQGICWPLSYHGDGFCDDGTLYAPDLNCAAAGFDGGDCP